MPKLKPTNWQLVSIGLAVRLFGVALIWLGDGSDSLFRKGLVIVGVILTVGGITVLRYMLFAPLLGKLRRKPPAPGLESRDAP